MRRKLQSDMEFELRKLRLEKELFLRERNEAVLQYREGLKEITRLWTTVRSYERIFEGLRHRRLERMKAFNENRILA